LKNKQFFSKNFYRVLPIQIIFFSAFIEITSLIALKSGFFPDLIAQSGITKPVHLQNQGINWRNESKPWGSWHKSNYSDRHSKECFDVEYVSNNFGARDNEDYPGDFGANSIILLGDSFAEGYGLPYEDTLARNIERKSGLKVFNFGAAYDFGPLQYYLSYKQFGSLIPHDKLVITFLPANDFADNDSSFMEAYGSTRYRPYYDVSDFDNEYPWFYPPNAVKRDDISLRKSLTSSALGKWISEISANSSALRVYRNLRLIMSGSLANQKPTKPPYLSASIDQQRAAVFYVQKILALAKSNGVSQVVLYSIPTIEDFNSSQVGTATSVLGQPFWLQHFRDLSESAVEFDFIDGFEVMRSSHGNILEPNTLFLSCDGHWSAFGAKTAASLIVNTIE